MREWEGRCQKVNVFTPRTIVTFALLQKNATSAVQTFGSLVVGVTLFRNDQSCDEKKNHLFDIVVRGTDLVVSPIPPRRTPSALHYVTHAKILHCWMLALRAETHDTYESQANESLRTHRKIAAERTRTRATHTSGSDTGFLCTAKRERPGIRSVHQVESLNCCWLSIVYEKPLNEKVQR